LLRNRIVIYKKSGNIRGLAFNSEVESLYGYTQGVIAKSKLIRYNYLAFQTNNFIKKYGY